jgi:hypothetical protein
MLWVGTRKGLFKIDHEKIVEHKFAGQPVSAVLATGKEILCALNLGHFGAKLWRSRDGGEKWDEIACPAYPKEEGGATLNQIWVLEGDDGGVWAGTIPGGLFRSSDGGESWRLIESLWRREERKLWFGGGADAPGIHSVMVDPRDAKRVTIAVSCGGVWKTRDGGETWTLGGPGMKAPYMPPEQADNPNIQDVHRVVQCPAKPEVLWAQHHSGMYRSTDGGASWQDLGAVKPSSFGFAVAVHPKNADTAWFVPAIKDELRYPVDGKLVVTRTADGGKSFRTLARGLPQEHAYDLVYRHGLDVDSSGEHLAIGSTTGGLWVSADGGDSWRCVNAHLPPIYCLRFA